VFVEGKRMAEEEYAYVYILANGFKKLYIGITTQTRFA
jgi:predicted GIY-YIG superfamily endonuclease